MRKNWHNPELISLGISETAGGPTQNYIQDGETWYDENNIPHIPTGEGECDEYC